MASSVNLGDRLDSAVDKLIAAGRYGSRSEVLREGVRLVEEREAQLTTLKAMLAEGVADADAGRLHDGDAVFDALERRYNEMAVARR